MKIITTVFVIIAFAIVAMGGYLAFFEWQQSNRSAAIDGCAIASRNIYTEQGQGFSRVIEEPDRNFFERCLTLKNIEQ